MSPIKWMANIIPIGWGDFCGCIKWCLMQEFNWICLRVQIIKYLGIIKVYSCICYFPRRDQEIEWVNSNCKFTELT